MPALLVFTLNDWRCALPLAAVAATHRAVAVTALPGAPYKVMGIINVRGTVLPAIDLRTCFGFARQPLSPDQHIVLGRTSRRPVALIVDGISGVIECAQDAVAAAGDVLPGLESIEGVVKLEDGMVLIHDLDRFLSLEEAAALDHAMEDI